MIINIHDDDGEEEGGGGDTLADDVYIYVWNLQQLTTWR